MDRWVARISLECLLFLRSRALHWAEFNDNAGVTNLGCCNFRIPCEIRKFKNVKVAKGNQPNVVKGWTCIDYIIEKNTESTELSLTARRYRFVLT